MSTTGRFAPSPSGPLHFGSLIAALASYCQARARQGRWLLRIEDVDTPRVIDGAVDCILRDLEAFGFEWDGEIVYQSHRFDLYQQHLEQLLHGSYCYACECSRKSLRRQGVQIGALGPIYPGNCRQKQLNLGKHSIRLNTNTANFVEFTDQVYGRVALNLPMSVGDFVLKRVDNIYAYHLAVVVDDALQGVDEIVRGADLLENTCLHIYLQRCLGFTHPRYLHLPLANNVQEVKLSKQTGARALEPRKAPQLLRAALNHLGQNPPPDLELDVTGTVQWAIDHWNPAAIPAARPSEVNSIE